ELVNGSHVAATTGGPRGPTAIPSASRAPPARPLLAAGRPAPAPPSATASSSKLDIAPTAAELGARKP
ncbi:hypothetical protein H0H93_007379, partial [Arthromyces matolae]